MPSGGVTPAGGSKPAFAAWSGGHVDIANDVTDPLDWGFFDDGDESILNITNQLQPKVTAAGYYLVSASLAAFPMTASGFYKVALFLDYENGSIENDADSRLSPGAADTGANVCVSAGGFIPNGHSIVAQVTNADGVATRTFSLHGCTIVRL